MVDLTLPDVPADLGDLEPVEVAQRLFGAHSLTLDIVGAEGFGERRVAEAVQAVQGADAVIVALGAPPSDRSGVRGEGTAAILRAMATHQVRRVLVLDAQGNRNRFDFKSPQLNVKIPKKEFKFKPPKGTNIISP